MIDAHIQFTGESDYQHLLDDALEFSGISGVIALQGSTDETAKRACLKCAEESDGFICGMVTSAPWADEKKMKLQIDVDVRTDLIVGYLADIRKTNAISWVQDEDVAHNLRLITERNIPLDLLTTTEQIPQLLTLIDSHPSLPIVLDHCSGSTPQSNTSWLRMIREIGRRPHVYYRLSGLTAGIEGDSAYELTELIKPCFETALEAFGITRILYGSGWPHMAATYPAWLNTVDNLVSDLSMDEKEALYGENALSFYGID